MNYNFISFFF